MAFRHRLDRYDEHGQDTYIPDEEELFAAEMAQPSTVPNPAHEPARAMVLCQTPVSCGKCGKSTRVHEDVLAMVDGELWHLECLEGHESDGSTDA